MVQKRKGQIAYLPSGQASGPQRLSFRFWSCVQREKYASSRYASYPASHGLSSARKTHLDSEVPRFGTLFTSDHAACTVLWQHELCRVLPASQHPRLSQLHTLHITFLTMLSPSTSRHVDLEGQRNVSQPYRASYSLPCSPPSFHVRNYGQDLEKRWEKARLMRHRLKWPVTLVSRLQTWHI